MLYFYAGCNQYSSKNISSLNLKPEKKYNNLGFH